MGLLSKNKAKVEVGKNVHQRSLPPDRNTLKCGPDPCHSVSGKELDARYNLLRTEEHARIDGKCGDLWTREVGLKPENASRNRYGNILPWDHSRVILPVQDESANDYINASWMQLGDRSYIAAQGPLASTIPHFWHMVYAYGGDPATVCMLTPLHENGVEKCTKYWPDEKSEKVEVQSSAEFGFGFTITVEKSTYNDHYNYTILRLSPSDGKPEKLVHHIYYYSWLDYTSPNADADLRSLVFLINNSIRNHAAPLIVHCSAGIGRSGTFIAIDSLMVKVDNELEGAIAPAKTPVWEDQLEFKYKPNPFSGPHENGYEDLYKDAEDGTADVSTGDANGISTSASGSNEDENTSPSVDVDNINLVRESAYEQGVDDMAIAMSPPKGASALTGPICIKKSPPKNEVPAVWKNKTPENLDLLNIYNDSEDDVLTVVRYMRMQRPKMVQGAQQLGYIYDQLEITEQLVRSHKRTERVTRRATVDIGHVNKTERSNSLASSQKSNKSTKSAAGRLLHRVNTFTSISGKRS